MYDIRHRNVYSAVPGHALNILRGPLRHKENLVLVAREIITFFDSTRDRQFELLSAGANPVRRRIFQRDTRSRRSALLD